MYKPQIGEQFSAKYPGVCSRSGKPFKAGEQIALDGFGYHLANAEEPDGHIAIATGSGYGEEYTIGDVFRESNGKRRILVVVRAKKRITAKTA